MYGLEADNRVVRADVFARKMGTLIAGLRMADVAANGKRSFNYMIDDLSRQQSALVRVREKRRVKGPVASSVDTYREVANSVYNGRKISERFPLTLIKSIHSLCTGIDRQFDYGELRFDNDNIIRIDDFLTDQSIIAERIYGAENLVQEHAYFSGISHGSIDGTIAEIDARGVGTMIRGKLIPTDGQVEIDCVMNKDLIPEIRSKFNKRSRISGVMHYSAGSALPKRMDVTEIRILNENRTADLSRWRGSLASVLADVDDSIW